ncbi:hypothetical protein ACIQ34_09165 [Ureibacillus sp. NPDC094379]
MNSKQYSIKNDVYTIGKNGDRIELALTSDSKVSFKIKKPSHIKGNEVTLSLEANDLDALSRMFEEAKQKLRTISQELEDESNIIMELDPPGDFVKDFLQEKYTVNQQYANLLLNRLLQKAEWNMQIKHLKKPEWYDPLTVIKTEWAQRQGSHIKNQKNKSNLKQPFTTSSYHHNYSYTENTLDTDRESYDENEYESIDNYVEDQAEELDMSIEDYLNSDEY